VVLVTWTDANAFCEWREARLPTEAEWEKTARGTDGRTFPWGYKFDCAKGNFDDETTFDAVTVSDGLQCDGYDLTAPVGNFPAGASPYGVLDMAGNVFEWVADWFDVAYYSFSPVVNPVGPDSGSNRSLRGGSWHSLEDITRSTNRAWGVPEAAFGIIGFRCAR
jgi:formylglycine-generating enzyme required for sulfatase activity